MFSFCKHYFFQKFFCKEGAHCTSCYVAVAFFLVLQNRTIGFEIKKFIVLGLFDPGISRKEQRQDITPDMLAHYRIKVITMVPYSKAHSKGKVHTNRQNRSEAQPSEFSINGTTFSLFRFVFYFFPSIFFISVYFVLLSLVSFHFVSFSLISFRFALYRYPYISV